MDPGKIKLDNYSGLWCIEPTRFSEMLQRVNSMNLLAHVTSQEPRVFDPKAAAFDTIEQGAIALIDIQGTMTKAGSSLGGGSTVEARRAIRKANEDKQVSSILLRFDTPGGSVSGTKDLADEIRSTTKPTIAFVEDLCCSAGMWCASQCDEIWANNATAMVGSIGTFMGLYDISKAFENEGIKAVVIKAGEYKGGGFPGSEITDAQIAEWQRQIDAIQAEFTASIASGRKLTNEQAQKLVTGLTYVAAEAVTLKLIDGIKTFDEVVAMMRSKTPQKGRIAMSENQTPGAASYREIVAACPGIDPKNADDAKFITECLADEMTAADVNELYCGTLQSKLKAATEQIAAQAQEIADLKAAVAALPKKPGAPAVGTATKVAETASPSEAAAQWRAAIDAKVASGMSRDKAVMAVAKEQPQLREAMLAAS